MTRTLQTALSVIATMLLAVTFLAACQDTDEQRGAPGNEEQTEEPEGEDEGSARTDQEEEDPPQGMSQGEQEGEEGPAQPSDRTDVTLVDYEIQGLDSVAEGVVTFTITNEADHEHGLAIAPAGGGETVGQMFVDAGETEQLELELAAGDYTAYCPVGDHRDAEGMETSLTVE